MALAFCLKSQETTSIKIMTFNIRRDGVEYDKKYQWKNRLPIVTTILDKEKPDIIGLQEPIKSQIKGLKKSLNKIHNLIN